MKNRKTKKLSPIKNVVIVYRPESAAALKLSGEVANWLKKKNLTVWSHPKQKIQDVPKLKSNQLKKTHLAVVLGGDGTYLQAVQLLGDHDAPILGANMGSLGFLTDIRKEDIYLALDLTLKGQLELRPRSMIDVKIKRGGKIVYESRALNDAVIERGASSHLINLAIYSQNHLVNEMKADGLVISTPTGSTAYNLAAGGPILHPDVHSVVVTPICPHALTNRPIIFPDNQTLTFRLSNKKQRAFLSVDGRNAGDLRANDEVIITRAKFDRYMIKKPSVNYFDLLREKLKFGER